MTYPQPYDSDGEELVEQAADRPEREPARVGYHGEGGDPTFGFIVSLALAIGLMPILPDHADLRFVAAWGALAGFGVLAWLTGDTARIERDTPGNLAWGIVFGLIVGTPLLAVGGAALATTADLLFRATVAGQVMPLSAGSALALLVFVGPLGETLFFRGLFQQRRPFWLVGLLASVWTAILFFPLLDIGRYPLVGVVMAVALLLMNLVYSYVRLRNGLAAAWLCQIVLNVMLLFIPYVSG